MEHRAWVGRWRDELKGLAILWIVYYHSQLDLPDGWNLLHQWGYGGVDIFFFLREWVYTTLCKKTTTCAGIPRAGFGVFCRLIFLCLSCGWHLCIPRTIFPPFRRSVESRGT